MFCFVIASGGGSDDADLDIDADIEADVDADADADANAGFAAATALGWLGIGKAPLVLLLATDLSLWGLLGCMLNVTVGASAGLMGGVVLLVSLIASLVTGGLIARPVGQAFAAFGEDTSSNRLIGCVGTVSTARIPSIAEGKIGQVDVLDPTRNLVTVNAALPDWAIVVPRRGDRVLVIDRPDQTYCVIVKDSPDQDRWFANSSHTPR